MPAPIDWTPPADAVPSPPPSTMASSPAPSSPPAGATVADTTAAVSDAISAAITGATPLASTSPLAAPPPPPPPVAGSVRKGEGEAVLDLAEAAPVGSPTTALGTSLAAAAAKAIAKGLHQEGGRVRTQIVPTRTCAYITGLSRLALNLPGYAP